MKRRVVITACSAITPIGYGKKDIVDSLQQGRSGVKPLRDDGLLTGHIHSRVFGTVDYPIAYEFTRSQRKTMGPVAYYACQVAKDVLAESGLSQEFISSGRLGVAFGSTHGSPTVQREIYKTFFQNLATEFSSIGAVDYLRSMVHTTAVNITRMFGITGRVIASSTACTTSSQAIGFGYEMVKYGMQDAMLCGGADEYDTTTVAVFDNLLACSVGYNDRPECTPRPFDRKRDGLVVGEGGGAVLLEEYEAAKKRGAPILAEVIGFACNNNGGDLILPNLEGITSTLRLALADAGDRPGGGRVHLCPCHGHQDGGHHRIPGHRGGLRPWPPCDRPEKLHRPHHGDLRGDRADHDPLYDGGRVPGPHPQPGRGRSPLRHGPPYPGSD